jgi:secreted protein with Ig-like and vWFA domain
MHTSSMSVQQLTAVTADFDDQDSELYATSLGTILYEIAPGAPLLSRQQISMILREASRNQIHGLSADVSISVQKDGSASIRIDYPGSVSN